MLIQRLFARESSANRTFPNRPARRGATALFTVLLALTAPLVVAGTAAATPPPVANSTLRLTSDVTVGSRLAGPNLIVTEDQLTAESTGALTGTISITYGGVVHADGSAQFQGRGSFTGVVTGCGSVTFDFTTDFRISATGEIEGRSAAVAGSRLAYHDTFTGSTSNSIFEAAAFYHC